MKFKQITQNINKIMLN